MKVETGQLWRLDTFDRDWTVIFIVCGLDDFTKTTSAIIVYDSEGDFSPGYFSKHWCRIDEMLQGESHELEGTFTRLK